MASQAELDNHLHTGAYLSETLPLGAHPLCIEKKKSLSSVMMAEVSGERRHSSQLTPTAGHGGEVTLDIPGTDELPSDCSLMLQSQSTTHGAEEPLTETSQPPTHEK